MEQLRLWEDLLDGEDAPGDEGRAAPRRLRHHRDVFHAWMLADVEFSPVWEMPVVQRCDARPARLVPFSQAMDEGCADLGAFVHFFEDDFRFERFWSDPRKYLPRLSRFAGVVMPDFSVATDFPAPLKMWAAYRNQLLAAWMQREGLAVVPAARAQPGCPWLLEGLPRGGTLAVCGRALVKDADERRRFLRDLRTTVEELRPDVVAYYGSAAYGAGELLESFGVEVLIYPGAGRGRLGGGEPGDGEDGGARGQR